MGSALCQPGCFNWHGGRRGIWFEAGIPMHGINCVHKPDEKQKRNLMSRQAVV